MSGQALASEVDRPVVISVGTAAGQGSICGRMERGAVRLRPPRTQQHNSKSSCFLRCFVASFLCSALRYATLRFLLRFRPGHACMHPCVVVAGGGFVLTFEV